MDGLRFGWVYYMDMVLWVSVLYYTQIVAMLPLPLHLQFAFACEFYQGERKHTAAKYSVKGEKPDESDPNIDRLRDTFNIQLQKARYEIL